MGREERATVARQLRRLAIELMDLDRQRWLSLAAMTVSSSWVNVDKSAFLCRYWRSSRLMFSLVPRCHGSK
jgi:hypothetical protein